MIQKMRRGLADTPTGQIHYLESGDGPPLLLLHMTNISSRAFRRVMPLLTSFRTLAPDLPGFGGSDPLEGEVDIVSFARSLIHFMDSLGIAKAHVFGLHAGNKVAATMAALWPERVERLVLSGLTHSLITDQKTRLASVPDYAQKLGQTKKEAGQLTLNDWIQLYGKLTKIWWRPSVVSKDGVTAEDLAPLEDEVLDILQSRYGYGAFYRASWAFDVGATLSKVSTPTLVIELVTRREAHLGRQGPVIEKLMQDCRSVAVEMHDYDFLYRHPEVLAGNLKSFCGA